MKNIGIVCEGPTDYLLLREVIDTITGMDNWYVPLQPEESLRGEYGNGWKGVWKWCADYKGLIKRYMRDITPQLDLIVIQMDGDVSRKEKEAHCMCDTTECDLRGIENPLECDRIKADKCPVELPCASHTSLVNGYREHLNHLIKNLLECDEGICITIPCDSTDAWIVAAYESLPDIELIRDPWINIISKGKAYHGVRTPGHRKSVITYREFLGCVCENWRMVKDSCVSAGLFDASIKEYFGIK